MPARGPYANRPIPELNPRQLEAFWAKVVRTPGCWIWTGSTTKNPTHPYGQFRVGGSHYMAHRVAWTLANGQIPAGHVVDHMCGITRCVNPEHLRLATQWENVEAGSLTRDAGGRFTTGAPA